MRPCDANDPTFPYPPPIVASGWHFQHLTSSLVHPRMIEFDSKGTLLVLDVGVGIVGLRARQDPSTRCWEASEKVSVVNDTTLTHGLALGKDGHSIYASSDTSVFRWTYDAVASLAFDMQTIVTGMSHDNGTRTLLIPSHNPHLLLVQTGTRIGADGTLPVVSTGQNQIKAFDLTTVKAGEPFDFLKDGAVLAYGLRNAVAVGEDSLGAIWSLENGANPLFRAGVDITADEPAEEMNYHGTLAGLDIISPRPASDFGFPACSTAWNVSDIPLNTGLRVDDQFFATSTNITAIPILLESPVGAPEGTVIKANDAFCLHNTTRPILPLQPHLAPLDIKFLPDGNALFTSHGSTEAGPGVPLNGYKVALIFGSSGFPIIGDGRGKIEDVLINQHDNQGCPDACFRPAGIALHPTQSNAVFVSADSTGDIFVLSRY
ncbi:hypothetical protein A0H81_00440 [Grifola frondosa]|uniref:Pyrroloquinoline quinone-dependent pyranose dehydrogenase beta-propeller domain-containing protein n=1 Tax=Grifola frondosa TaxID=5627 RepID=A0A1C7MSZ3_GRIFR|nr:hypothetical protein A0H81_00440 [Grifola frondosa]